MTSELQGVVLNKEPLTTITADLVNHDLILTMRFVVTQYYTETISLHILGPKLRDLMRLATLVQDEANTPPSTTQADEVFLTTLRSELAYVKECIIPLQRWGRAQEAMEYLNLLGNRIAKRLGEL